MTTMKTPRLASTPQVRRYLTCEECGKRAYLSKRAAKVARVNIGDHSLHLYKQHGSWHLGHMKPGTTRAYYRGDTEPSDLLEESES